MSVPSQLPDSFPPLAPVDLPDHDAVSHSLSILSRVYHYNHWIFDMIRPWLGQYILEVGAGIGNITEFLLNRRQVTCLEPFDAYRDYLIERLRDHRNIRIRPETLENYVHSDSMERPVDTVVCLNVLEHIEDDYKAVKQMRETLTTPNGQLIILVPAMPCLFAPLDQAMGHHRRYTRRRLNSLCRHSQLNVRRLRYMNLVGVLGWWFAKRRRRQTIPPTLTEKFDKLVPYLSAIERLLPIPVGQSLLLIAQKGDADRSNDQESLPRPKD